MNELEILHDAWERPEPPTRAARAHARAALTARAAERPRRLVTRLALAGGLALALAAGITAAGSLTGSDKLVPPANAAQVLERAAQRAAAKPFTAPRPEQWIYAADHVARYAADGTLLGETVHRSWKRADGRGHAFDRGGGEVVVEPTDRPKRGRPGPPLESSAWFASLPTDPDALLRWAYGLDMENGDDPKDAVVFLYLSHMLRGNLLPPELESAIFRALKRIPGVTVVERDLVVAGQHAVAIGYAGDWLHEELLLDRETYAYLGQRSEVTRNTTISPEKAGNATGVVAKGSKVVTTRIHTAIVDAAGERS